jgi:hypothetical protein
MIQGLFNFSLLLLISHGIHGNLMRPFSVYSVSSVVPSKIPNAVTLDFKDFKNLNSNSNGGGPNGADPTQHVSGLPLPELRVRAKNSFHSGIANLADFVL